MSEIPLFILYGSATGNAEFIAKDLAKKYKDNVPSPFNKVVCHEANDFKKKCLPIWEKEPSQEIARKYGLVFVTSTTGNGDSPENGSRFVRYLKRKTTAFSFPLKHVAYGVLGLGDTNYDMFCETGKISDKKIADCGGERVKSLGMADEGTGLEDVVDGWVEDIVPLLAKACTPASDKSHDEEKKSEETAIQLAQPFGSKPSVPMNRGVPNVQSILNQRLGRSATSFTDSGSTPPVAAEGKLQAEPLTYTLQAVQETAKENVMTKEHSKGTTVKSPSPLFILYGSATGNAEQIAKNLSVEYKKLLSSKEDECYFPDVICCELDQFKKKCMKIWEDGTMLSTRVNQKHGVLIITSTTGNADAPENASRFTRWVKRKTTVESMPFKHVAYAVLGLGDTNYDQFCATAHLVDKKLKDLGGTRLKDIACADEGTGLEQVVDPWVKDIFVVISEGSKGNQAITEESSKSVDNEAKEGSDEFPIMPSSCAAAEEKKTPENEYQINCTMSETGVTIIRKLLGEFEIPKIDFSLLPSLGTSLSSCQLLGDDEMTDRKSSHGLSLSEIERLTVSSASSSNIHYTLKDPFESTIIGARYLTKTKLDGARSACKSLDFSNPVNTVSREDGIISAMAHLQSSFPLDTQTVCQRLSETNGKRVIEMKLSLPDDFTLEYLPGDSVGLVISNSSVATKFVLDMLQKNHGIASTQKVSLDDKHPITVATAIRDRIDLCSPIKNKRLLANLAQFATNAEEANALNLLASKDSTGKDLYNRYIDGQSMSVFDILTRFPSCQSITLEGLLSSLPGIAPRYYSISSSPLGEKDASLHLTVAFSVVDYLTPIMVLPDGTKLQRRIGGLATRYLEAMCAPHLIGASNVESRFSIDRIKIFPKPTAEFRLPLSLTTPLVLIGPGTGVAPFIGFLKHREGQLAAMDSTKAAKVASEGTWRGGFDLEEEDLSLSKNDAKGLNMGAEYRSDQRIGDIALYYGCRHKDHDWLYQSEMECLEKSGIITSLRIAFSRDSDVPKSYVQDELRNDANLITNMVIENDASIFICGDGNAMAKDVQRCLVDIFADNFGQSVTSDEAIDKATKFVEELKKKGRLLLDIWS